MRVHPTGKVTVFTGSHSHGQGHETTFAQVVADPATGHTRGDRMTACDDFGNVINPMIVEGQVHGGLAQGIGQALLEHGVYDPETGQLLTGSDMDYAMPRVDDLPAVINAICNALGVKDVPMPATPYTVWKAVQAAR